MPSSYFGALSSAKYWLLHQHLQSAELLKKGLTDLEMLIPGWSEEEIEQGGMDGGFGGFGGGGYGPSHDDIYEQLFGMRGGGGGFPRGHSHTYSHF